MKTKIGGQAVIEGVMMRGATSMALSVRDETGQIRVETTRLPAKKPWYRKVPFVRGVVNLVISMIDGFKIIGKSAEVMVEDEIDASEGKGMGAMMAFSMLLGILLAVGLFIVVPTAVTTGIFALFKLDEVQFAWLKSLIEGVCKMLVLVGYMGGISCMKEIKRVFMYHGAEHKTIACYEAEMPLTVENVQKCSRYHDRCGTSFLVFVVLLSVLLMMVLDVVCIACNFTAFVEKQNWWLRALLKIALLPVTAGFSYEMLMLLACSNFVLFRPLKWLGKQFQKLTTREPDDGMCEVAICSFQKVLEMDADQTVPEVHFPKPVTLEQFKTIVEQSGLTKYVGKADEWLLCAVLHLKPADLHKDVKIPFGWTVRVEKMRERIEKGEPWQYVVGSACFYGRTFAVDNRVLIPRPETELVTEQAILRANDGDKALDLCCGSGAIGATLALECKNRGKNVSVTCADVSKDALKVAKYNAKQLGAKVTFAQSDMFRNVKGTFDLIVCNPPYVETATISALDDSVKNFEPHSALDGGVDGLKFYRILATEAPKHLKKGGVLVMEIGYNQGNDVVKLFEGSFDVELKKDYGANDRIVVATLR
ncbi:MAG: peptide chain release factor N(5)-glutamine methyltransferase [Candidatus Fimimonas sp.]